MAVIDQTITADYALYNADCMDVMRDMPPASVHLSVYSPPFGGLYTYSSDARDLSNCRDYEQFLEHYQFIVAELERVTMPGRICAVHCSEIPSGNSGTDHIRDLPGDLIRVHEAEGFHYVARHVIWKEPLGVRLRTLAKSLAHQAIIEDGADGGVASADYLLIFRRHGENPVPIAHPHGLTYYAGSNDIPPEIQRYRGWAGKQTENRYSQWIWRQYASSVWGDVRLGRLLPFVDSKERDDEQHVHPLQLDVIDRVVSLRSNPGEVVFTPFMGVGSEVYSAVTLGRKGVGAELKTSYYRQAVLNLKSAVRNEDSDYEVRQSQMFEE